MDITKELLNKIRKLEKEADEKIKPFYYMIPEKERLSFLKALNEYAQINIQIEDIIKTN